ncbi:Gfo/Idh/MocA family protein [Eleftheria terrae]|uniref:Gfo/Idh/MocA family protein n=1 Tax=Eleftheria terrae TaxID=1597781 RepID=UPI00263BAF53|nr:Gfo/Idh/MocA family oxidoreductase [Eleftheria terrae]WKB55084.1 Gfo/Idh/MocA family oxidoreductase [Eleftheria terrae]
MVGGGRDAFIGAVHRQALALDGRWQLVAGALSSDPEKARASGRDLGLPDDRNHGCWQDLLEDEIARPPGERIDLVCIVTPNHLHYPVARAFTEAGFHVVCDKPLANNSEQARHLVALCEREGTVFGVTYNYTGYPMVRQARALVQGGAIGEVRKVVVEYNQGWLARDVERSGNKQAGWRTDPERSGRAGAIGDIGSHAENLVATVTGLEIEAVCADLSTFVPGRRLEDDGNLLLRYSSGACGVLMATQVAAGCENDLSLRVFGSEGSLSWRQEEPNQLLLCPADGPRQLFTRGSPWLHEAARRATRLPAGHPEAFIEAFANVYIGVAEAIQARREGRIPVAWEADHPTVQDGARGVWFIEKTVESSRSAQKWTFWE